MRVLGVLGAVRCPGHRWAHRGGGGESRLPPASLIAGFCKQPSAGANGKLCICSASCPQKVL